MVHQGYQVDSDLEPISEYDRHMEPGGRFPILDSEVALFHSPTEASYSASFAVGGFGSPTEVRWVFGSSIAGVRVTSVATKGVPVSGGDEAKAVVVTIRLTNGHRLDLGFAAIRVGSTVDLVTFFSQLGRSLAPTELRSVVKAAPTGWPAIRTVPWPDRDGVPRSYVHEARKRVGPKRRRIRPVIERLTAEHADAGIALRFRDPLELLVSVMLSAQTTDVNVNRVTERLFEKYRRPEDYLAVPVEELERDIFQTGFFRQKAKSLRGTMAILIEDYDGEVPEDFDALLRLPGVARKTANVVTAERGKAQGIVVDTHVRRLSQRLGFTREEDPVKIERDLIRLVPRRGLGALPAPADLARPAGLRRAPPGVRGLRRSSTSARRAGRRRRPTSGVSATSSPPSSS